MTEHTANGESISSSESKEVDSPLTVCDLIAVFNSLFGEGGMISVILSPNANRCLRNLRACHGPGAEYVFN